MEVWLPSAERHSGPSRKTSGASWPKRGAVYHSSEGSLAGALAVLHDLRPRPNGRLRGSWHFTNAKDGRLYQHYSLDVIAWHAHGGNTANFGVENEGRAGEPLTEAQIANLANITAWAKRVCEWGELSRVEPGQNLWEHQEVGILHNYVTLCPSRRIPWARVMLLAEKEDKMLQELDSRMKQSSVLALIAAKALAGAKITNEEKALVLAVINALPMTN